jgi:hypothetical protein
MGRASNTQTANGAVGVEFARSDVFVQASDLQGGGVPAARG